MFIVCYIYVSVTLYHLLHCSTTVIEFYLILLQSVMIHHVIFSSTFTSLTKVQALLVKVSPSLLIQASSSLLTRARRTGTMMMMTRRTGTLTMMTRVKRIGTMIERLVSICAPCLRHGASFLLSPFSFHHRHFSF